MSELQNRCRTSVAVIGAGHAGIEAALACARMGVDTVLFTLSLDAVANLPCNPSIGGTAKGHLVYAITNTKIIFAKYNMPRLLST